MDSRLLLLSLVLWVGSVSCFDVLDVTAECCASYKTRWEEYGVCVNKYGFVPVCDGGMRGCYFGNRFYKVGEVVQIIPTKCMMLVCSSVTVNYKAPRSDGEGQSSSGQMVASNTKTVQVKVVQVSSDCGCCEHEGKLHRNGSVVNLNRHMCNPKVCIDGKWIDVKSNHYYKDPYYTYSNPYNYRDEGDSEYGEDEEKPAADPIANRSRDLDVEAGRGKDRERQENGYSYNNYYYGCCYYYGQYYAHGESIMTYNQSYGSSCYRRRCYYGYILTTYYSCCCIEDGEMYSCNSFYPLPSSDHETCHIRKCCDGVIETHHEPGCCFYNGKVYKPDQFIGYTSDYCQRRVCRDGVVVEEDARRCCNVNGVYYKSNEIVEQNSEKCILKICMWTTVVDRSIDYCPCCIYNNNLYRNGSSITLGSCQTLVCEDGKWVPDCEPSKCHYCYVGSHFRTFDGVVYHYNPPCNHTLVQRYYSYYSYYSYYTISLSYKRCSVPFNNVLTCPDVLTIKHYYNVAVTLAPGGNIQVNGNPVTSLPYSGSNGLFIYETAFAFNVYTFYGLVVMYGKGHNPSVRILTPTYNYNRLYGLCGAYNGNSYGDLRPRSYYSYTTSISYFVNTWKTGEPNCIGGESSGTTCSTIGSSKLAELRTWCSDLFDGCTCLNATLNESDFQTACDNYMCSCLPCMDDECKTSIISKYAIDCANLGGIIDIVDEVTTTAATTTTATAAIAAARRSDGDIVE